MSMDAVCDRLLNSRSLSLFGTALLLTLLVSLSIGIAWAEQDVTKTSPASERISNSSITPSSQYSYSTPPLHLWTCFDHSMNYSKHNPEWGVLLVSNHPQMLGMGHFMNYQINYSDNSLIIHDEFLENDRIIRGWQYDSDTFDYYHFYIDSERPTRWFNFQNKFHIRPNAEEVYRDWILTR